MHRLANAPNAPELSRTINTRSPATVTSAYEPGREPTESQRATHTHDVDIARCCSSTNTPASQYAERSRLASIRRRWPAADLPTAERPLRRVRQGRWQFPSP